MPRPTTGTSEKVEIQLTPMIDIVFQLLIFFILTFRVTLPEGQFTIKLPEGAGAAAEGPMEIPPINVRLDGDAEGHLTQITLGQKPLGTDMRVLEAELADAAGIGMKVQIDADPNLTYDYLIQVIDICAKLQITQIEFAPPRQAAPG